MGKRCLKRNTVQAAPGNQRTSSTRDPVQFVTKLEYPILANEIITVKIPLGKYEAAVNWVTNITNIERVGMNDQIPSLPFVRYVHEDYPQETSDLDATTVVDMWAEVQRYRNTIMALPSTCTTTITGHQPIPAIFMQEDFLTDVARLMELHPVKFSAPRNQQDRRDIIARYSSYETMKEPWIHPANGFIAYPAMVNPSAKHRRDFKKYMLKFFKNEIQPNNRVKMAETDYLQLYFNHEYKTLGCRLTAPNFKEKLLKVFGSTFGFSNGHGVSINL